MEISLFKNSSTTPIEAGIIILSVLLFFFLLINAYGMLFGDEVLQLKYLNIYSREPLTAISLYHTGIIRIIGFISGVSALLYFSSLLTQEAIRPNGSGSLLTWAVFSSIIGMSVFGGLIRSISNQQGAANIYFFTVLLYLLFKQLGKKYTKSAPIIKTIQLLPVYFMIAYTMGIPGWTKLFGNQKAIEKYEAMFADSFIAILPGGTFFMICILGVLEFIVPFILIISLAKGEFKMSGNKFWLNTALVVTCLTFTMLCFGLTILFNFAGAANLIFYAIFTFFILVSVNYNKKTTLEN